MTALLAALLALPTAPPPTPWPPLDYPRFCASQHAGAFVALIIPYREEPWIECTRAFRYTLTALPESIIGRAHEPRIEPFALPRASIAHEARAGGTRDARAHD